MIDLSDLIILAIYIKLRRFKGKDALKFTWIEIHHLILYIT